MHNEHTILISYSDLQKITATLSRNDNVGYRRSEQSTHEVACQITANLKRDNLVIKGDWSDCEEEKVCIQYSFTKTDELFSYIPHGDDYLNTIFLNGELTELGEHLTVFLDSSRRQFGRELQHNRETNSVITLVHFKGDWHVFPVGLTELRAVFGRELLLTSTSVSALADVKANLSRATCLKIHSRLHSPSSLSLGAEAHCDVNAILQAIDDKNDFEFEQCRRIMAVHGGYFLDLRSEEDREVDAADEVKVFNNIIIIK